MRSLFRFLLALWKTNLLSAMEYRAAFISQVLGMMLNNAVYFLFWVIFFDRFKEVRGWELDDLFILFGTVAAGFGACVFLFGNITAVADMIANGRLDYYLALPRPVLVHVLASRSITSGLGDFTYGLLSFLVARQLSPDAVARFILGTLVSMSVFLSFMVLVQSLAFWAGNAQLLASQASNAIMTFALYPISLFDGSAKFLLFTIIPAALMGTVPAEFVKSFSWSGLLQLLGGSLILLVLSISVFYRGLQRYESGSAIQVQQ